MVCAYTCRLCIERKQSMNMSYISSLSFLDRTNWTRLVCLSLVHHRLRPLRHYQHCALLRGVILRTKSPLNIRVSGFVVVRRDKRALRPLLKDIWTWRTDLLSWLLTSSAGRFYPENYKTQEAPSSSLPFRQAQWSLTSGESER